MSIENYNVSDLYTDTQLFNDIGGNLVDKPTMSNLVAQFRVLASEVDELKYGLNTLDNVEILDGVVDVTVVIFGFIQLLKKMGFNVNEAMERVAVNNLTKFELYIQDAIKSRDSYLREGKSVSIEHNYKHDVYVLKNDAGKIMKPKTFKPVDLSDLVPKDVAQ